MKAVVAFFMVVSLLGLGLAPRAEAREEAHFKIGYVDLGRVIDHYPKAKEAEEALRKKQEAKQRELMEMQEEISKLEAELREQGPLLKEEERERRTRTIERRRKEWEQLFRAYDTEMRGRVFEKQREVLAQVRQVVESFAKEKGYTLILDARQVIYSLEGLDITEEIIKLLNKAPEPQTE